MSALKGTMLLRHAILDGAGAITSYEHTIDDQIYNKLKYHYLVLIAEKVNGLRKVKAGFAIKTDLMQGDPNFLRIMIESCELIPTFKQYSDGNHTFLPQRFSVVEGQLSEHEFLLLMTEMYMKYHVDGKA